MTNSVEDAIAIWKAGVAAVEPRTLVIDAISRFSPTLRHDIASAPCIEVVGAGKAGAAMAHGLEEALTESLHKVTGIVNVPNKDWAHCQRIEIHPARPVGSNFPTADGVAGTLRMLTLLKEAGPEDVAICLLSGGGSALMPAPADGITLEEKVAVTRLLHASGASIHELNTVRRSISKVKGGRLANAFRGQWLISLIISDVIGDSPEDIASGPTQPTETQWNNFDLALSVLRDHGLLESCPESVLRRLEPGAGWREPEESNPTDRLGTINMLIGTNSLALAAAMKFVSRAGFHAETLAGDFALDRMVLGEAKIAALKLVAQVRTTQPRPTAILFGGETTVTLGPNPGKGGRNQEFVLAMLCELGIDGMQGVTILSGGTDGEDGPTDAAGAIGTQETLLRARALNLNPRDFLDRHDAYHFFEATGGLFKTGLTGTNVMDLGVVLLT